MGWLGKLELNEGVQLISETQVVSEAALAVGE